MVKTMGVAWGAALASTGEYVCCQQAKMSRMVTQEDLIFGRDQCTLYHPVQPPHGRWQGQVHRAFSEKDKASASNGVSAILHLPNMCCGLLLLAVATCHLYASLLLEAELEDPTPTRSRSPGSSNKQAEAEAELEDPTSTPTRSRSLNSSNKHKRPATSGLQTVSMPKRRGCHSNVQPQGVEDPKPMPTDGCPPVSQAPGLGLELLPLPKKRRGGYGGGRPKKQQPEGMELVPKKPRGRPRKPQQALDEGGSSALIVSPDRAGRAKALFYDLVTEDINDESFPRVNHISDDDLKTLNNATVEDLKKLAQKAKKMNVSLYTTDYEVERPDDRADALPLGLEASKPARRHSL
ncbi:hypothetical protein ZWY2020_012748 [Hordeum vulgare]|nr:hypothetical protein ZWY2020_012748 [Hordeum vulgare]